VGDGTAIAVDASRAGRRGWKKIQAASAATPIPPSAIHFSLDPDRRESTPRVLASLSRKARAASGSSLPVAALSPPAMRRSLAYACSRCSSFRPR